MLITSSTQHKTVTSSLQHKKVNHFLAYTFLLEFPLRWHGIIQNARSQIPDVLPEGGCGMHVVFQNVGSWMHVVFQNVGSWMHVVFQNARSWMHTWCRKYVGGCTLQFRMHEVGCRMHDRDVG